MVMTGSISSALPIEFPRGEDDSQHGLVTITGGAGAAQSSSDQQSIKIITAAGEGEQDEGEEEKAAKPRTWGLLGAELGLLASGGYNYPINPYGGAYGGAYGANPYLYGYPG